MEKWTEVYTNTVTHRFYTGGWNCAFCGSYTNYGQQHYCWNRQAFFTQSEPAPKYLPQWQPKSIQVTYPDPMLTEVRDLLKQLIVLLEDKHEKTS